jgi:hypothetical protein
MAKCPLMSRLSPLAAVSLAGRSEWHDRYMGAVLFGQRDTQSSAEAEIRQTPTRLVSLALNRVPRLGAYTYIIDAGAATAELLAEVKATAAGALRLAHRALEVHGRAMDYSVAVWIERIFDGSELILREAREAEDASRAFDQVSDATLYLTRAVQGLENDRMAVPEYLATALSHLFVLFLLGD